MNRIDEGIVAPWDPELTDALKRWRLGVLIENPPLTFAGHASAPLWKPGGDGDRPDVDGPVPITAPYGIITSQTCNIAERPETPSFPWVQVSPVYEMHPERIGSRTYLYPLTASRLAGRFFADLRLEAPLEKSALAALEPLEAFAVEDDEIAFAERLGRQRDRAALHDVINNVLYGRWRKKRANNKSKAARVLPQIHMVGMLIPQGNRLEPVAVECHFVGSGGPLDQEAVEWLQAWWDAASVAAQEATPPVTLLPNVFHDGTQTDVELYDQLIPLPAWLET